MRVCVYGAGAIGGYIAARLAQGGLDVSAVARGAHLEAIRKRGLSVETRTERFTVSLPASDKPEDLGRQDLVIVAAKTPAFPEIADGIGPLLGAETAVAFAVNGVLWFYGDTPTPSGRRPDASRLDPGGNLHARIGVERAIGWINYSPNEVVAPGRIVVEGRSKFEIGDALGDGGRARRIAAALAAAGLAVAAVPDIRRAMWVKLVGNVGSAPIAILTGASAQDSNAVPALKAMRLDLMREALAVAAAHGHTELGIDLETRTGGASAHKPSILQDLERGRKMEIDSLLAILADFAREAGVATPLLDTLLPLVVLRAQLAGCYAAPSP